MRKIFCFCILLFGCYSSYAQSKEDILLEKIRNTTSDTSKASFYNLLANEFAASDSAKTFKYAELAFLLST